MKDFGLISIIMAAYNAEKTIGAAIQSVLDQTYTCFELIVINDHSTDRTQAIVESFHDSRIHLINNPGNIGVSWTRHTGVEQAQGEWIAILDSDDMWEPNKLDRQIKTQQQTNADLLFTGSAFMTHDGQRLDWTLHVPATVQYKELLKQNIISNSSILIRKSLYLTHESIGDQMHEDFACFLRVLKTGVTAYGIDEPLLVYRLSKGSKTGNKWQSMVMNWRTYRYVGLKPLTSVYYMIWYICRGILKYRNLI